MKILHIGRAENMERYTEPTEFSTLCEVVCLPMGLPEAEYIQAAQDAEVIIADAIAEVSAGLIEGMPHLKLIHSEGVAYNRIDLEAARKRGIAVCNCAGMNASAVAEQTVLLMLGVLHDVAGNDAAVREGRQIQVKECYMTAGSLKELADCTVGLIGFGNIARETARRLRAFGTEVYYYKRTPAEQSVEEEYHAHYLPLAELLGKCDVVSLHLPVTPDTAGMCDDAFFAQMKKGSYLINTSRGELVDSAALVRAIQSGTIAMAGLDTLEKEPVQPDHPLLNQPEEIMRKILFSPHIGGITASSFRRGYRIIWENIRAASDGKNFQYVVNG